MARPIFSVYGLWALPRMNLSAHFLFAHSTLPPSVSLSVCLSVCLSIILEQSMGNPPNFWAILWAKYEKKKEKKRDGEESVFRTHSFSSYILLLLCRRRLSCYFLPISHSSSLFFYIFAGNEREERERERERKKEKESHHHFYGLKMWIDTVSQSPSPAPHLFPPTTIQAVHKTGEIE